ncbi:protein kinase [Streptomyces sp. Tu 3180]|nr:protein kinase [Streptomyces sp. Tu 3180]
MASRCSAEVLAGRYRLDALIGSGGAADVHRGLDLRLRRPVAVKVFRTGADADMEERFRSEGVILARLQHPGLVTAYDTGLHNGRAYLVMQLIEGPTLKGRIAAGPLPPEETAALGAGLARALAHAHEASVVHRDVKPSNIILDRSGTPHLTDFGVSRLLDATTRTDTGALIGTAAYLAPEQVLGRPVGRPADIYALGLVLLECLTGRLEYEGAPLEAAIARLHRRPVLPDSLPEELRSLLRDMTALDDQSRPTATDCARRLAALAGTAGPVPFPSPAAATAAATSLVPSRTPVRDAGPTHRDPPPTAGTAGPKTASARGRALIAGGTATLAAVMAAAFVVPDGSPSQGSDARAPRAVDRPSTQAEPPHASSTTRNGTTPATPPSSPRDTSAGPPRDTSAGPLGDTATERITRAVPTVPGRTPDTGAADTGAAPAPDSGSRVTPSGRTPDGPGTEAGASSRTKTPDARPGTPGRTEKTRTGPQAENKR